jgi:predicted benzoate:H+ symporter BenE
MRYKQLTIIVLAFIMVAFKPIRAQSKLDSAIIGTDTSQNLANIMLSKEAQPTKKEKWEAALIIAGISIIMVILFNARSK